MAWWVSVSPEVVRGIESFGFKNPGLDRILESTEDYLKNFGDQCFEDRWSQNPDDFFVYSHIFIENGRLRTLVYLVNDTSAESGILKVVWVERHLGDLL